MAEEEVGQLILFDKWLLEDGTEVGPGQNRSNVLSTFLFTVAF